MKTYLAKHIQKIKIKISTKGWFFSLIFLFYFLFSTHGETTFPSNLYNEVYVK